MGIRVRTTDRAEQRIFEDDADLLSSMQRGEVSGQDEYFAPAEDAWFALDTHPKYSTTDARGIFPAILHLVVFIKILVFIAFLSLLDGNPDALLHTGAIYVYIVLLGDALAIALVYRNQNRLAAVLLWIFGIASMPLGLFLVISAKMTRDFRYHSAG